MSHSVWDTASNKMGGKGMGNGSERGQKARIGVDLLYVFDEMLLRSMRCAGLEYALTMYKWVSEPGPNSRCVRVCVLIIARKSTIVLDTFDIEVTTYGSRHPSSSRPRRTTATH